MIFSAVVQAAPAPNLNLTLTTSCASATGSWIVGINAGVITFVKTRPPPAEPTVYATDQKLTDMRNFLGGKCYEASPTTVYYVAEAFLGYLTVDDKNSTFMQWQDLDKVPQSVTRGTMDPKMTAIGKAASGTGVTVLAAISGSLIRWDTAAGTGSTIGPLADLKIDPTKIGGMTLSNGLNTSYLWIALRGDKNDVQLFKYDLSPNVKFAGVLIPTSLTFPQNLVPWNNGDDGVALLGSRPEAVQGNIVVTFVPSAGATSNRTLVTPESATLSQDEFVVGKTTVTQINPAGASVHIIGDDTPITGDPTHRPETTPPPSPTQPTKKSYTAVIIGSIVGVLFVALVAAFLLNGKKKGRGKRSIFAKKQKDLFPVKGGDDTLVPLGLYHQDRSLPEIPRHLENDLERLGYGPRPADTLAQAKTLENHGGLQVASAGHSRNSSRTHLDETIPIEAALAHHRHDQHTPQGLTHSISVRSTTSNFPRRSAKTGKRFDEKIQLQVIRYEVQDAHLISPHGPTGRLVLGTYHVVSPPRSARSIKAQGGVAQGIARSGTVFVRRSRLDLGGAGGAGQSSSGRSSPIQDAGEDSSMLLTDAENQHTFEAATLKWYMTELHWKREAALLKHLKSPIFVMELLESYCIPALQNRANAYPFVNAMGGCSSLLSDLGPVRTAPHARSILRSISAAVEWCHRHGVVHLNIQPGSFFLEEGIDPTAEDASWKLWDFTCARFMGESIGAFGGGGGKSSSSSSTPQPPPNHLHPEAYPFLAEQQHEEQMDRIGGNPLPPVYTAPELLEAWREGDMTFPAEAGMDTWSLGCVYYEILTGGQPLFRTEAEAWGLVGGWENRQSWTSKDFKVPYPPLPDGNMLSRDAMVVTDHSTPYERSQILDPSGSISQLLQDMMSLNADERVSLETIMERIY
ncbi:hypothetical protein BGX28_003573 [Mortierella sp. GBA30]|nr:hypothetical protein BGX28_003573 [Mortierella sp. GBA30]